MLKAIQATVAGSRCNCHEFTNLSVHTPFAMPTRLNSLSAHVQAFALFAVVASVPYASLGEGRYVGQKHFSHYHIQRAHAKTVLYLDASRFLVVAHTGRHLS